MTVAAGQVAHWRAVAERAGRALDHAEPGEVVAWAVETFGDRFCVSSSMADAVLIDLVSRAAPGVDVVFLDTGYHFAQTLQTRDRVVERYPITLREVTPLQTVAEQDALFGPRLHDRDPDACCTLRKVEPLRRSLEPYLAWASGIRRDETAHRRSIGVVEWDSNRRIVKVNPLANWVQRRVDEYVLAHDVEINDLLDDGYPSIGCAPCTRRVDAGDDPRSGRWAGSGKTECGLHVDR